MSQSSSHLQLYLSGRHSHLLDVKEESLIMDVQLANLLQLCDAIVSKRSKISEECLLNLLHEELKLF